MATDCIFCKIGRGEIKAPIVYEDEWSVAFVDLRPMNPGHTLVIPKNHTETFLDMAEEDYQALMRTVHIVAKKVHAAFPSPRLSFMTKGFDVAHTHVHLIPLIAADDLVSGKYGGQPPPEATWEDQEVMAKKIKGE